ncbi:MAG: ankyrin repeat domain-containing protein [Lewinellaceae bacterium]|nr:ankyrin repeat domain-containing protein [Saprospiraceae bacterium]MCB9330934.1 ankyrin repeat domain-containing protein [Lewinellaceae bacterium]
MSVDPDIFDAVKFGDIETVKAYWTSEIDVDYQDQKGMNLLMYAAEYGHNEILKFLLTKKPNDNLKAQHGKTALDFAKGNGHENTVKLLKDYQKWI